MWNYRGRVTRVIDGDTIDVLVDLGFHVQSTQRLRLLGIDTPERTEPGWLEATAYTRSLLPIGQEVIIRTEKSDSFGRFLAEVFPVDEQDGIAAGSINASLLASGHAIEYIR